MPPRMPALGWPPNYISQALNQGLGQNFFEFVNGFRVAAAECCLADPPDKRTILEVALACGFGSKSTFNAVFKRMTDRTPSQYLTSRGNTSNGVFASGELMDVASSAAANLTAMSMTRGIRVLQPGIYLKPAIPT
jgi:AraC-like DNA-binding protein